MALEDKSATSAEAVLSVAPLLGSYQEFATLGAAAEPVGEGIVLRP